MLKQLAQLSVEADGRYATSQELQFLKNYLQTVDQRVSAYEKIRDAEEAIVEQTQAKAKTLDSNAFLRSHDVPGSSRDVSGRAKYDNTMLLQFAAAAMLFDELDRFKESLLVWHRTIMKSFQVQHPTQITYKVLPDVVKQHLTPEEAALLMPALRLIQVNYSY